ncbi:MAG: carbamoylphosphate synthase large subunit [Lachnospiraceae bacterium]|nr:carbamoylphosphate synthase large subunit [Lachnospiraceae bacterium]
MNYIFISPAYPVTCTLFCDRLHEAGVNVLGIGDMPYETLNDQLKSALMEYYYVTSLEDYDQVYRAAAFFIHKYGRIDCLESLNEYWLPTDARLRTDFNIEGTREDEIRTFVSKSEMKKIFLDAKIPTARQHIVSEPASGKEFAAHAGYPVIVKPDVGVGANGAMKLHTEEELDEFYRNLPDEPYVMEEFMDGDICTYDAIIDSQCEPLFESMCTYAPVIDAVQDDEDVSFYTVAEVPQQLLELGRRTVRAFGASRRFVHFEFIKLAKDHKGIGKAGDYAVMEVNMRPAGGHDPDMMNFAQSTDVFRIYAEMITEDRRISPRPEDRYICAYAARKDGHTFRHTHAEIMERYGTDIVMQEEMPPIDWPSMGRYVYMAKFRKKEEMDEYFDFVLGR